MNIKPIRAAGVPLVAIETADPAATINACCKSLNGKAKEIPIVKWDSVGAFVGLTEMGQGILPEICGGVDPNTVTNPTEAIAFLAKAPEFNPAAFARSKGSNMPQVLWQSPTKKNLCVVESHDDLSKIQGVLASLSGCQRVWFCVQIGHVWKRPLVVPRMYRGHKARKIIAPGVFKAPGRLMTFTTFSFTVTPQDIWPELFWPLLQLHWVDPAKDALVFDAARMQVDEILGAHGVSPQDWVGKTLPVLAAAQVS